ncbi:Werner Syndrome-like exonuclease [Olea europaea subsp. europaea]|uniref:Werner Syndrome-like exonuclease n=1 Tax=Olea europaea subsp. europaea TaxID=158383 RepID=A0A8S0TV43_OLEEU|nr:Werner Syndrome-like exonuclease [Olea europaea subsp. europaea]
MTPGMTLRLHLKYLLLKLIALEEIEISWREKHKNRNWEVEVLSKERLKYAAMDAYVYWYLYQALKSFRRASRSSVWTTQLATAASCSGRSQLIERRNIIFGHALWEFHLHSWAEAPTIADQFKGINLA